MISFGCLRPSDRQGISLLVSLGLPDLNLELVGDLIFLGMGRPEFIDLLRLKMCKARNKYGKNSLGGLDAPIEDHEFRVSNCLRVLDQNQATIELTLSVEPMKYICILVEASGDS